LHSRCKADLFSLLRPSHAYNHVIDPISWFAECIGRLDRPSHKRIRLQRLARPTAYGNFFLRAGTRRIPAHLTGTMKLGYHTIQGSNSTRPVLAHGLMSVCGDRLEVGADNPG
jgi:hypothetical protein